MAEKRYRMMDYAFDNVAFSAAIKAMHEHFSWQELSDLMGISKSTLNNWANGNWAPEFPHPHMSNFLLVCNMLDLNPVDFFLMVDRE